MRLCISCVIFLGLFAGTGFSETIILKSGQRVDAKITENTDEYVKLDFFGVELVYYKDEISSIVPGNDVVSPQLKSLYQAYSSSLNIPPKPKEEKAVLLPSPEATRPAETVPVVSGPSPGVDLSQLPPEYTKMIQMVTQGMQGAGSGKSGAVNPAGGLPAGMDLSKLPPEYQKIIQSATANLDAGKLGGKVKNDK